MESIQRNAQDSKVRLDRFGRPSRFDALPDRLDAGTAMASRFPRLRRCGVRAGATVAAIFCFLPVLSSTLRIGGRR